MEEKCEAVPRKSPDGVIETFVDAQIIPDVDVSYKTYETETFDGTVIKIDETNIISQEKVEDVLETTLVPSDAEVIAPGRDFVYLADADNYYVE